MQVCEGLAFPFEYEISCQDVNQSSVRFSEFVFFISAGYKCVSAREPSDYIAPELTAKQN